MEHRQNDEKEGQIISWDIPTHHAKERTMVFYIIVFVCMAGLLLFAAWQKDFLFGMFIILASGTVLYLSMQQPHPVSFALTETTIVIDRETVHPFARIAHFDIYDFTPNDSDILFVFKGRARPMLRIPVWKGDKEKIRTFLLTKLPQKATEPSLLDILSKIVGI